MPLRDNPTVLPDPLLRVSSSDIVPATVGRKAIEMVHEAPPPRLAGHVDAVISKSFPTAMLENETEDEPKFSIVIDLTADVWPTVTFPHSREDGLNMRVLTSGPPWSEPVRYSWVTFPKLSSAFTDPVIDPAATGLETTDTLQLPPGASVFGLAGQSSPSAKCPDVHILAIVTGVDASFVRVAVLG